MVFLIGYLYELSQYVYKFGTYDYMDMLINLCGAIFTIWLIKECK